MSQVDYVCFLRKVSGMRHLAALPGALCFASVLVGGWIVVVVCSLFLQVGVRVRGTQKYADLLGGSVCQHKRNVLSRRNAVRRRLPVAGARLS